MKKYRVQINIVCFYVWAESFAQAVERAETMLEWQHPHEFEKGILQVTVEVSRG